LKKKDTKCCGQRLGLKRYKESINLLKVRMKLIGF
jgi:hypothetical protein